MVDLNALPLSELFEELTADGCLERLLDAAMAEDFGSAGDITTKSIVSGNEVAQAQLVLREAGTVAGLAAAARVCGEGNHCEFTAVARDGQRCADDSLIGRLSGRLSEMLGIERILLNLIGRLSGIATLTRRYVDAVAGTEAVICDTRKTTPGMRNLEKYAVRCGGGTLHRLGLFDAALYKDNHIAGTPLCKLAGRLSEAIRLVRREHEVRFVEVEVDELEQLREVLTVEAGLIDMILLDNMPPEVLTQAVAMRDSSKSKILLEASGGVNLESVRSIAEAGVDRISVGALTHSATCLDVGLDISDA